MLALEHFACVVVQNPAYAVNASHAAQLFHWVIKLITALPQKSKTCSLSCSPIKMHWNTKKEAVMIKNKYILYVCVCVQKFGIGKIS